MSEMFMCFGKPVFFTNGMVEVLYLSWSQVAAEKGYAALAELLLHQSRSGPGCCATGMDREYLEDNFLADDLLSQWLVVMKAVLSDIQDNGPISKRMDVVWSKELRASLLDRLHLLADALEPISKKGFWSQM